MNHCYVCSTKIEDDSFGNYCSKTCRDSEIAIIGKTCFCSCCNRTFKSLTKKEICLNCEKSETEIMSNHSNMQLSSSKLSEFDYSIFQDNINRIFEAAKNDDQRNCKHAAYIISKTIDKSMIPELAKIMDTSNEKTKIWLIEILAKLKDKTAIKYLEDYLNEKESAEVKIKAEEAIKLLESY